MMRHRLPFLRFRPVIYGASPMSARLAALQDSTIAQKKSAVGVKARRRAEKNAQENGRNERYGIGAASQSLKAASC